MAAPRKNTTKYLVFCADPKSCIDASSESIGNGIYNTLEAAYGAIMNDSVNRFDFNRINTNEATITLPTQISEKGYKVDVLEIIPKYGSNNELDVLLTYYILATNNNSKGETEECE